MSQNGETHFKILQQMLQDFSNVSDRFGTLCIKGLKVPFSFNYFILFFLFTWNAESSLITNFLLLLTTLLFKDFKVCQISICVTKLPIWLIQVAGTAARVHVSISSDTLIYEHRILTVCSPCEEMTFETNFTVADHILIIRTAFFGNSTISCWHRHCSPNLHHR